MAGCTNCNAKSGCDDRKGGMLEQVDRTLERLYPSRTWGEVADDEVAALSPDELAGLADELAQELKAATFVRPGDDDETCDYIYVLCMGRSPCIAAVRDHGVVAPAEWHDGPRIDELYLRVVLSHRARVAGVQQVAMSVERSEGRHPSEGRGLGKGEEGARPSDHRWSEGRHPSEGKGLGKGEEGARPSDHRSTGFVIHERPRAGVYDAPLLHRMQKLVAILPAYELLHVDFGEISHPPPGFHAGSWSQLFGGAPAIANYLFYPQPTTMVSTSYVAG